MLSVFKFHEVEVVLNVVLGCLIGGKYKWASNLNHLIDIERTGTNMYGTHTYISECASREGIRVSVAFVEVVAGLYP
jgi:hypothetical protein